MDLVIAQFEGVMWGYNAAVGDLKGNGDIDFIDVKEWLVINSMGACAWTHVCTSTPVGQDNA